MRQLALQADDLKVDSFPTQDAARDKGTAVAGMTDYWSCLPCPTDTIGRPCPP